MNAVRGKFWGKSGVFLKDHHGAHGRLTRSLISSISAGGEITSQGHGGPPTLSFVASPFRDSIRSAWAALLVCWLSALPAVVAQDLPRSETADAPETKPHEEAGAAVRRTNFRLRLTWGGGPQELWHVSVFVGEGRISAPEILAMEGDALGSAKIVGDQQLVVHALSKTAFGGVDFTVDAKDETPILVEVYSQKNPGIRASKKFQLAELRDASIGAVIDPQGNRFVVARVPGDQLRIETKRPHLIFQPGESWRFAVFPNFLAGSNNRNLRCVARLRNVAQPKQVLETLTWELRPDDYGGFAAFDGELKTPAMEGVYELSFTLEPRWYQAGFANRNPALRTVQFLVLAAEPPGRKSDTPWSLVHDVRWDETAKDDFPTRMASMIDPFNKLRGSPPATESRRDPITLRSGDQRIATLAVPEANRPYLVRVRYQATGVASLGMSLLDADRLGGFSNFGFNAGVVHPSDFTASNDDGPSREHWVEMVIWPNNKNPSLLLANRSQGCDILVTHVEVWVGPERLVGRKHPDNSRGILAFAELPLFAENFNGERAIDQASGELIDDWQTFYSAADRLIQYLKFSGHSGLMISINGNGGCLAPLQSLPSNPRYDTGRFSSTGQDPQQKDLLEMLFRMFDREGLRLIPAVTFADPLPSLESVADSEGKNAIRLVDDRGEVCPPNQVLPRYHALTSAVQDAMTEVLSEILDRYAGHRNFEGLAVVCRGDTYAILPGRRWGYDRETVTAFAESQPGLNLESSPESFKDFIDQELLGRRRQDWIEWRCQRLVQLYQRWEELISLRKPQGRLYLAGIELFRSGDLPQQLSPSLRKSASATEALRELGWDAKSLATLRHTVVLQPTRVAPTESLIKQRIELSQNRSRGLAEFYGQQPYAATLFTHRDQWIRSQTLAAPAGQSPAQWHRLQPIAPTGHAGLKRFAEAIFRNDALELFDGGWLIATQNDPAFQRFAAALQELPKEKFRDVYPRGSQQSRRPVAVRQSNSREGWLGYAVNSSPWKCRVTLNFKVHPDQLQLIPPAGEQVNRHNALQTKVTFELEPFALVALRARSADLMDFEVQMPVQAATAVRSYLHRLQSSLAAASEPQPIQKLSNPEFFRSQGGWHFPKQSGQTVNFIPTAPESVSDAMQLTSTGTVAWVRSDWFDAPETGRLSLVVWMRAPDAAAQPPLRVAIESEATPLEYYRYAEFGSLVPDQPEQQLTSQWKPFVVHFDDLPMHTAARLRVGFDLMRAGTVEIDRIELYDRLFEKSELQALTQLIASIRALTTDADLVDEARFLLEGYWPQFIDRVFDAMAIDASAASPSATETAENNDAAGDSSRPGFIFRRQRRR